MTWQGDSRRSPRVRRGLAGQAQADAIHIWDANRGKTMDSTLDEAGELDVDRGSSRYMASLLVAARRGAFRWTWGEGSRS